MIEIVYDEKYDKYFYRVKGPKGKVIIESFYYTDPSNTRRAIKYLKRILSQDPEIVKV